MGWPRLRRGDAPRVVGFDVPAVPATPPPRWLAEALATAHGVAPGVAPAPPPEDGDRA